MELVVVIAIMAILAAIAIPTFSIFIKKAREAVDIRYMRDVEYAIRLAHADDPSVEITGFIVYVRADSGYVEDIRYTVSRGLDEEGVKMDDEVYSHKEGNGDNASPIIDWEYSFKAWKTVSTNPNWQPNWSLVLVESPENQVVPEQSGQNPPVNDIPDYRQ